MEGGRDEVFRKEGWGAEEKIEISDMQRELYFSQNRMRERKGWNRIDLYFHL